MSSRKRKLRVGSATKKAKRPFDANRRSLLASSDRGSYFQQQNQWPEEFNEELGASSKKLPRELVMKTTTTTSSQDGDRQEITPSLSIVNGAQLNEHLQTIVSCKFCGSSVQLLEENTKRQGLGTYWTIKCTNEDCNCNSTFPTSSKSGKFFEVNRLAVLGFRSIGRGHSAAEKVFGIMGLPAPINHNSWAEHMNLIEGKSKDLLEKELDKANRELKEKLEQGEARTVDTGASFDGSWCSRGWSATDACVAAISVESGKV